MAATKKTTTPKGVEQDASTQDITQLLEMMKSMQEQFAITSNENKELKEKLEKINEDVEERYTWGIDLYTYRNLLNLFPENFTDDDDHAKDFKHFIENGLLTFVYSTISKG